MTPENQEKFQSQYRAGKEALERGQYRLSIQHLEAASKNVNPTSRIGGETKIWLLSAYQAAGKITEAIALCQQLTVHPHPEIRKQSKRLLYIIQAPKLERPKEWMSEIPDLSALEDSDLKDRRGSNAPKIKSKSSLREENLLDLSQVNTQDNQFIWIALLVVLLTIGSLIWLS